jgi:hypothetical protein
MLKIKEIIAAILVVATSQCAQAAAIPLVDGFVPLQYTKNLSISEFLAGVGGWNQSYHLASEYEIADLLAAFQITSHEARLFTLAEYDYIYEVGGHTLGPYGTYFSDGNQGAIGRSYGAWVSVDLTNGENSQAYASCPAFSECSSPIIRFEQQSLNYKDNQSGLFLVEGTVPEPGSMALIALGLGGLWLRRRTK